ncbi:MAG: ABC transporter ATP-binding protein [Flavobacteriaceae bacterium]|nr:ABC transporter ATP-binding protein [Flavobacteriaceae bacterium]
MYILQVDHIKKSFGKNNVLEDISFSLSAGTLTGITGENGCGKTTLLKLITGHYKADSGSINKSGQLGYCPQECILFPHLTARENFNYFAVAYGLSMSDADRQMSHLLSCFNFEKYIDYKVNTLSSGTQQKLNLCIALLHQPDLLVLDEPYNGFDWNTYTKFWEYSLELKDKGCAILVVAHLLTNTDIFDAIYNIENGLMK